MKRIPSNYWNYDDKQARLLSGAGRGPEGLRRGDQEGLSQARHGVPPRPQQGRGGERAFQGDQRGLPGAQRLQEAQQLRHVRPCRGQHERRGIRRLRELRRLRRHLRRLLRRWRPTVRNGSATGGRPPGRHHHRLREGGLRGREGHRDPAERDLLSVPGRSVGAGHVAGHLRSVPRQWAGAPEPAGHLRPVHTGLDMHHVSRRGQCHHDSLLELPGRGNGDARS